MTCSKFYNWSVIAPEFKPRPAWVLTQFLGGMKPPFLIFSPKTGSHDSTLERTFLDVVSIIAAPESNVGERSTVAFRHFRCIRENGNGFCNLPKNHYFQELSFKAKLLMWFSASLLWNLTLRLFKASSMKGYYYFLPRKDINIVQCASLSWRTILFPVYTHLEATIYVFGKINLI